jgi:ribosomal protein L37E
MAGPIKTGSNILADLARAKALFQQRTIVAILSEGAPESKLAQICRRCGSAMHPGIAMGQTYTGIPDFPGDTHATTFSPGGPGVVVQCSKCTACGWSVTGGE